MSASGADTIPRDPVNWETKGIACFKRMDLRSTHCRCDAQTACLLRRSLSSEQVQSQMQTPNRDLKRPSPTKREVLRRLENRCPTITRVSTAHLRTLSARRGFKQQTHRRDWTLLIKYRRVSCEVISKGQNGSRSLMALTYQTRVLN